MPFAGFEDFDDCVKTVMAKQGVDEEAAKRICGELQAKHENVKFITKPVLIESEGHFCYVNDYDPSGPPVCDSIVKAEMEKTIQYVDSIAIVEGLNHRDPDSLRMVVGKINDLHLEEVDDRWWLAGTGHFDPDRITGNFKKHLTLNRPIAGSISNWVEVVNGTQAEMFPTHFLMHPDLEPNIPGAGTNAANAAVLVVRIRNNENFRSRTMGDTPAQEVAGLKKENEELSAKLAALEAENKALSKVKEENVKLKAANDSYAEQVGKIEEDRKAAIRLRIANAGYTPDELKDMSLRELELTMNAIERSNDQIRENLKKTEEMQIVEIRQQLIEHGLTIGDMKDWSLSEMQNALAVVNKLVAPPGNPTVSQHNVKVGGVGPSDRSSVWDVYQQKRENGEFQKQV